MQGILLVMCVIFRARQHALGLDDFGRPINPTHSHPSLDDSAALPTTPAVEAAVGDAVQSDVRSEHGVDVADAQEETPLLPAKQHDAGTKRNGLLRWLKR